MASTTVTPYGNNLTTPVPQSGWQVEADGFGLLQAQVKFKWDISQRNEFTTKFKRGTLLSELISGVDGNYADMGIWKANMVTDKNNVLIVTADFSGIDPTNPEGADRTQTQVVMTGATASEPIEHHPNFLVRNCTSDGLENVLAGFPPASGWNDKVTPPINPATGVGGNPNRALWTPKVAQGGAIQGQQFVGFLPNQEFGEYPDHINIKAGIKNYYKPSNTLRCLFYVGNETTAVSLASYVGWNSDGSIYHLPAAYKDLTGSSYPGAFQYSTAFKARINRGFLITNCSVERFGNIFKVTADMMLSGISGWDPDIYPHTSGV
jgi:hypothetical protein